MGYRIAADIVVIAHLGFVAFVVLGGLLALRRPRLAWFHLPAAAWGIWIEWVGWICPLTHLESRLRRLAGGAGYHGGFVEHYLIPALYPESLGRGTQVALGLAALAVNVWVYGLVIARRRAVGRARPGEPPASVPSHRASRGAPRGLP